jgi:acrylyl-CoA reductase (NADPH)
MFKAIYLTQEGKDTHAELRTLDEGELPPGDVDVRVAYSTLNFKDALAITGKGAIVRRWPMVPGIDLAGAVESSRHPDWKPGDRVVVTGWGLGETHWGGLAERARLQSGWLLKPPPFFSLRQCMTVGTAGFTAALCALALDDHGLKPGSGDILVTGAAGGVGSFAVSILAGMGFDVVASTGRPEEAAYLKRLGALRIIDRAELSAAGKPLQTERWAGVVDTVGSHTLANACAGTKWYGAVAACGLAQGADFPSTVMPFILRAVTLYGINSVMVPNEDRKRAWDLIGRHVDAARIEQMTTEIGLSEVIAFAPAFLEGKVRGRTVVNVHR